MKNEVKIDEKKEKDFAEEVDAGKERAKNSSIEDGEHRTPAASVIAIASAQL